MQRDRPAIYEVPPCFRAAAYHLQLVRGETDGMELRGVTRLRFPLAVHQSLFCVCLKLDFQFALDADASGHGSHN